MNQEGLYESVDCYGLRPFVCKAEFYDKTPEWDISALGAVVGCQEGWKLLGIHCYRYFDGKINFTLLNRHFFISGFSKWNSIIKTLVKIAEIDPVN